jgi:hypothetical protein
MLVGQNAFSLIQDGEEYASCLRVNPNALTLLRTFSESLFTLVLMVLEIVMSLLYFCAMKTCILSLFFLCAVLPASAQYELYKEVGQVSFYTKWGREKWYSKKSPKVLLIKIVNKSSFAVDLDLTVEFYKNLALVEESQPVSQCLGSGKTLLPRMAGLVFKPAQIAPEEIDGFELSGTDGVVLDTPDCRPEGR